MLHVKGKGHPGGLQGGAVGGRQSKALATSGLKHHGKATSQVQLKKGGSAMPQGLGGCEPSFCCVGIPCKHSRGEALQLRQHKPPLPAQN